MRLPSSGQALILLTLPLVASAAVRPGTPSLTGTVGPSHSPGSQGRIYLLGVRTHAINLQSAAGLSTRALVQLEYLYTPRYHADKNHRYGGRVGAGDRPVGRGSSFPPGRGSTGSAIA